MNYIGIIMNRNIFFISFVSILFSSSDIFWDLGVAISKYSINPSITQSFNLSTYHRIEGLKHYYVEDYSTAISHFEKINFEDHKLVIYEFSNAHFHTNNPDKALEILNTFNGLKGDENLQYLLSKILISLMMYEEALIVLDELKNNFKNSDYSDIIMFEIEKINLLK